MRASEILDAQGDLLTRLKFDPMFRQHTILASTASFAVAPGPLSKASLAPGEYFTVSLTRHVAAAYAYRVTHDMCILLDHVAASLDESDTFDRHMAPTQCGMVRFDRPIKVLDIRGMTMLAHWAVWGPVEMTDGARTDHGLGFAFYNDAWTEPDEVWSDFYERSAQQGLNATPEVYEFSKKIIGRWASIAQIVVPHGRSLGPPTREGPQSQQDWVTSQGSTPHAATNLVRYMHALFLLLNQTITQVEDEYPDRPARRRAMKAGLPPKVTVISLRRKVGPPREPDESMVEWSHRWHSRGHLRWQPYGPRATDHPHELGVASKGPSMHSERWCIIPGCNHHVERIWVHGSIKGPPGAPLIISDKLYDLNR